MSTIPRVTIEREVLLFKIERRCAFPDCNGRVFIGLTKAEALQYNGFDCSLCERWNSDDLKKTDVSDWWNEIRPIPKPAH